MLTSLFATLLAGAIITNVALRGIGLEVLDTKEIRLKPVLIKSGLISIITFIVFLIHYVIRVFVLQTLGLTYLNLLVLALIVVGVNELYLLVANKVKGNLPSGSLFGLQSIVLLVGFLNLGDHFGTLFVSVLGLLIGYIAISLLFTIISVRLRVAPVLNAFKGLPILLIILGLIILAFTGLGGIL